MMKTRKIALHNLGCKVNSYELDVVQQSLVEKGYEIVPFHEEADIYIVNTCTVTNIADRKSRQMLHRAKARNPLAVVVAVGCYVQTGKEDVVMDDCIDLAIGNNRKKELVSILEEYLENRGTSEVDKTLKDTTIIDVNNTYEYEEMTLKKTAEHTRAYIKIQDGCNQFCSYCIIPYARGRVRSRKLEDVLSEIKGIVETGYQEVVLTGIHISSYGIDFEGKRVYSGQSKLIDLLEKVQKIEGLKRIRIGSLEPRIVTEEFARRLAALDKVCPHFHLSLQSGSDATLKRMNRHYSAGEYYDSVKILRKYFDRPAITTDVIVGFPQESEAEFQETCAFLNKIRFFEMHIFKYSKRKGTVAANMPGQVPDTVKAERSSRLLEMEAEHSRDFRSFYIGKAAEVLFEECKVINGKKYQLGHTRDYVKVALETEEDLTNQIVTVKIDAFLNNEILNALKFSDK
jgi:threonylcarbamoyladenosine tRNA methylthiotransferase MtaB